jgi:hypothetical protein
MAIIKKIKQLLATEWGQEKSCILLTKMKINKSLWRTIKISQKTKNKLSYNLAMTLLVL